jgi:ribonuclease P protein component
LSREHYGEALATGRTRTRRYFTLYVRPNGESLARIGIITSKRVAPRAVDRNRMKRMVREAFRSMRQRLQGVDIVMQLRRCPPRSSTASARAEVIHLLEEYAAPAGGDGISR